MEKVKLSFDLLKCIFYHHWNRYNKIFIIPDLKELNHISFVVTAAVVVSYGDRKKSSRHHPLCSLYTQGQK